MSESLCVRMAIFVLAVFAAGPAHLAIAESAAKSPTAVAVPAKCPSTPGLTCVAVTALSISPHELDDVVSVVEHDLGASRRMQVVRAGGSEMRPESAREVDWDKWASAGVAYLVVLGLKDSALQYWLLDVEARTHKESYAIPFTDKRGLIRRGDAISDLVEHAVTGDEGTARARLLCVEKHGEGRGAMWTLNIRSWNSERSDLLIRASAPMSSPAWSPAMQLVAVVEASRGIPEILLYNASKGSEVHRDTEPGIKGSLVWSPDGKSLAYTISNGVGSDIYVVDTVSFAKRRLTSGPGNSFDPSWSPDGSRIAFASTRGGAAQIYLMNPDGSNVKPVQTLQGSAVEPRFSPDGNTLTFAVGDKGASRIGLLQLQTGALKYATEGPADSLPQFSPNGQFLSFSSVRDNRSHVLVRAIDGGGDFDVDVADGEVTACDWGPLSPLPQPAQE